MEDSRNIGINEDMLQLSVYQTVENNKEQPENPKGDRATDSSADEQITSEDSVYHYTEESGDESSGIVLDFNFIVFLTCAVFARSGGKIYC